MVNSMVYGVFFLKKKRLKRITNPPSINEGGTEKVWVEHVVFIDRLVAPEQLSDWTK